MSELYNTFHSKLNFYIWHSKKVLVHVKKADLDSNSNSLAGGINNAYVTKLMTVFKVSTNVSKND